MKEPADTLLQGNLWWIRDPANPVLPPAGEARPDGARCMNPWVVQVGGEYRLYYSGGDGSGFQNLFLATAPVNDPTRWVRRGIVLEHGAPGAFDHLWAVLPHVIPSPEGWRLYYSGNRGSGEGLSTFAGIGLAYSEDGIHFERHSRDPVLGPSREPEAPDCRGVAGGSVIEIESGDGAPRWRFYYTGFPTIGDDLFLNQQKVVCCAESDDGIRWEKRGALIFRNPDRDYIDVAAAGPVVWRERDGLYRMLLSAIGTRWGYYSICYAESDDGIEWRTGAGYGEDLVLGPTGDGWERRMVEYPSVIREPGSGRLRLFYCGNGYGATGIGTALAAPMRASGIDGAPAFRIATDGLPRPSACRIIDALSGAAGPFHCDDDSGAKWRGPTGDGMIWRESLYSGPDRTRLRVRVIVFHRETGLEVKITAINIGERAVRNLRVRASIEPGGGALFAIGDIGIGETGSVVAEVVAGPNDAPDGSAVLSLKRSGA